MTDLPKQFFVAGTDTDVGKTHVSVQIIKKLLKGKESVGVMKPIAAGGFLCNGQMANEDAMALIEASRSNQPYKQVNPYLFEEAVSPHILTKRARLEIDLDMLCETFSQVKNSHDRVLVEGAGGWMTPLTDNLTMADLATKLGIPVVLVVGLKLGCLNHAQLTERAINDAGLELAGWVANETEAGMLYGQENIEYLNSQMKSPPLAHFSYRKGH